MLAGLVSSEASPWLASGCLLTTSSYDRLAVCVPVLISSYKDSSPVGLGSTHMTSFYFNYFFKGLFSKYIQRYWGMRISTYEFGENTDQPLTVSALENSLVVFLNI